MEVTWLDLVLLVLINGLIDCTLVAYFSGRQSKKAILRALREPDEEINAALSNLVTFAWNWFLTPVETGRTVKTKDEEGQETEVKEMLSPYQQIIAESGRLMLAKLNAATGGTVTKMKNILENSAAETGVGVSTAARNAAARGNLGPLITEIVLPRIMERFKKPPVNEGGGGW